jgi:putative methionine-R-sulfoxide reductase with GAF domain
VSASSGTLEAIERILNRGGDADEVLRDVVAVVRDRIDRYSWVGISFVEEEKLVLGPAKGERSAEPTTFPISYENIVVAELGVVAQELGSEDDAFLQRVALLISPYCLVGWDTGGEAWSP